MDCGQGAVALLARWRDARQVTELLGNEDEVFTGYFINLLQDDKSVRAC